MFGRSNYGTTAGVGWDRTTFAEHAAIVDESGDEVRVHGDPSTEVRASPGRRIRCRVSQDAPQCQDTVTTRQDRP